MKTTIPDTSVPCPRDKVNRKFRAPAPNMLWVSDFTYVSTWQGVEASTCIASAAARHGAFGAYPQPAQIEPGQLWPPPNDGRAERVGLACRAPPGRPSDAAECNLRGQNP